VESRAALMASAFVGESTDLLADDLVEFGIVLDIALLTMGSSTRQEGFRRL